MTKKKKLTIIYWVLLIIAGLALYISLRTSYYQIEYGLIALVFWGATYYVHRLLKKEN